VPKRGPVENHPNWLSHRKSVEIIGRQYRRNPLIPPAVGALIGIGELRRSLCLTLAYLNPHRTVDQKLFFNKPQIPRIRHAQKAISTRTIVPNRIPPTKTAIRSERSKLCDPFVAMS